MYGFFDLYPMSCVVRHWLEDTVHFKSHWYQLVMDYAMAVLVGDNQLDAKMHVGK